MPAQTYSTSDYCNLSGALGHDFVADVEIRTGITGCSGATINVAELRNSPNVTVFRRGPAGTLLINPPAPGTGAHGIQTQYGKLWFAVPPGRMIYRIDPMLPNGQRRFAFTTPHLLIRIPKQRIDDVSEARSGVQALFVCESVR